MHSSKRGAASARLRRGTGAQLAGAVRIIGGDYRGRRLPVIATPDLRPTPDRVRETLFNWLGQRLDGCACADLFAGTGALGFEAASRGASRVVMVERDRAAFAGLARARALLRAERVELVCADARDFLRREGGRFDVVFLDPPFRQNAVPDVLPLVAARLAPGARVYVEGPAPWEPPAGGAERRPEGGQPAQFVELRRGRAGQVSFQLLQWTGGGAT